MREVKFMKKILSLVGLFFAITIFSNEAFSQNKYENGKVANYSVGKYSSPAYEHFSFWVDADGKPLEIFYSMKDRNKETVFTYLGKTADGKGFKVKAPNGATSSIYVVGNNLRVVNNKTKRAKTFKWEYEGPVNGIGTFCTPCVEEPKEAAAFMKKYFI